MMSTLVEDCRSLSKDCRSHVDSSLLKKITEHRRDFPENWQYDRRKEYIRGQLEDLLFEALRLMCLQTLYIKKQRILEILLIEDSIERYARAAVRVLDELYRINPRRAKNANEITPAMIEQARAYPFSQLIAFKRNMALCPFHSDHDPSMALMKDNTVRCFSCNRSWDTIAFIREREGLSFPAAVRALQ